MNIPGGFRKAIHSSGGYVARMCRAAYPNPPPRSSNEELLDDHVRRSQREIAMNLADIRAINRWFGGNASVIRTVAPLCRHLAETNHHPLTLLDVATGSGDVPLALRNWATRHKVPLHTYASDVLKRILDEAQRYTAGTMPLICHDALNLPFADNTFDIITCVQALHHFRPQDAVVLLRELARGARHAVVVSDLRRSWNAYWGARMVSVGLRSYLSRHDGPLSALRAYTPAEACQLIDMAGLNAHVSSDGLFRLAITIVKPTSALASLLSPEPSSISPHPTAHHHSAPTSGDTSADSP